MPPIDIKILTNTPGPWHVKPPPSMDRGNPWSVYGPDDFPLAIISVLRQPAQANATLIAAAPEMYATLRQFVERVETRDIESTLTYARALAAIAMAEGRQS